MTNKTVLSDDAMLPLEFKSGNCIPVSRALITKDRMIEILRTTEQALLQSPEIQQMKQRELQLAAYVMVLATATESMAEDLGIDLNEAKVTLEINGKALSSASLQSVINKGRAAIAAMEVKP